MQIVAIGTIFNEADIIETSLTHLLNHGCRVVVAVGPTTDGTRDILASFPITIIDDDRDHHYQPYWINRLAHEYAQPGDWVLPFDADEFHYPCAGGLLTDLIVPDDINILLVASHQHRDYDHRFTTMAGMGKIMCRWHPDAQIANGNHYVTGLPGDGLADIVHLREIQFRSFEHMTIKCRERTDRIDPSLPYGEGTHQRLLAAMTPAELTQVWEARQAAPVVYDPIPLLTERVPRTIAMSGEMRLR